jgi:hypothetical protein
MIIQQLLLYGTLWGLILSLASIAGAVVLQQRQSNATIYLELTARLSQLFHSLSLEIRLARVTGELPAEELRTEVSVACYEYLSLICSAYQLYRGHYFSGSLWRMLRRDIEHALKGAALRSEWEKQRATFSRFPHFVSYVDLVQA